MKKRVISLVLALTMVLSLLPGTVFASAGYDDIEGHWASSSIERWSTYNIVEGSNGHFRPNDVLTRGQMAKILANALGLTDRGTLNPFTDVPSDAWYTPFVLCCYKAGIMQGDGVKAKPNAPISRQEAMAMMCRALSIQPVAGPDLSNYGDADKVSGWAAGYVAAMTRTGIINGVGNNMLAPTANINRASIMTILDRAVVQYINAPGTYTLPAGSGLVLVAAGDVTLKGITSADILVTPAASGRSVTFDAANVSGSVTVQGNDVKVLNKDSAIPQVIALGTGVTTENVKPSKPSIGGGTIGDWDTGGWNTGDGNTGGTPTNPPAAASVSLGANATGEGGRLAVGDKLTATVSNAGTATLVWNIGGFDRESTNTEYTVTAADLGKVIFVKLVKDGTQIARSGEYTVSSSAPVDVASGMAPVQVTAGSVYYKVTGDAKIEVNVNPTDENTKLVLSVEPKQVTEEEKGKVTGDESVKQLLVTSVKTAIGASASSEDLTDEQKSELNKATQVIAVDVDLTLVTTTTDETTGATTTEETQVHPVGTTTVTLSASQLGLAGEDLRLYHFVAHHTNVYGESQAIEGKVSSDGTCVTFVTNGLSTIWVGNVPPRTVTFDTVGGTVVPSQKVRFGSTVDTTALPKIEKSGYLFCGWDYDLSKTPIISNLTVTAKWVSGTLVPANRYTVTLSDSTAALATESANGSFTIKANPDATYAAGITASVSVTPYAGATQYALSTSAETAANATDTTLIKSDAAISLTPNVTVTNGDGKVVAGKTSYYIKWMGANNTVLALEELLVVVNDGTAAATKVITRDINRGVGIFEPYLTSSTKTDAPKWVGFINGDPEQRWNQNDWEYYLRTNVHFQRLGIQGNNYTHFDYDQLHVVFTGFGQEAYTGKTCTAKVRYGSGSNGQVEQNCTPEVGTDGKLYVTVDLRGLNVPATSSTISMALSVTVDGVTQDIYIGTVNPLYQGADAGGNQDHEYKTAATMAELQAILNQCTQDSSGKTYSIEYPAVTYDESGQPSGVVDSTDAVTIDAATSLVIPANTALIIRANSLTIAAEGSITLKAEAGRAAQLSVLGDTGSKMTVSGTLTMESGEASAADVYCGVYGQSSASGMFTVENGGKVIINDIRGTTSGGTWGTSICAETVAVKSGAVITANSNTYLYLHSPNNQSSLTGTCTFEAGSSVVVTDAYFHVQDFDQAEFNGEITMTGQGNLYFYNNMNRVGGSITAGSGQWSNVEFYGETVVETGGKIRSDGSAGGAFVGVHGALTNNGTIELAQGAEAIITNTGFTVYNKGTFTIGSNSHVSLQGTTLVNTGAISGTGSVSASLGYDLTNYAMNHTGLEYVAVTGQSTLDNYSRYKFVNDPATTIDITLYKGELVNEAGGTATGVQIQPPEDYPAN